jgi:CRP/FNR family transcriptional regulator, cyclic AMP receptor protein
MAFIFSPTGRSFEGAARGPSQKTHSGFPLLRYAHEQKDSKCYLRSPGKGDSMEKVDYLRRVPIFCMLEPKILTVLAELTRPQHYHKGQIIFYRGDPGNAMYVLITGLVELTLPSETGSEVLVARLHSGEHFGELAVLDGRSRWVTAVAAEPTQVLAIYREALLDFLRQHAEASLQVALSLCLRLRHITELLSDMAFLDLASRLAKRLCEMADVLHEGHTEAKDIRITQEDLAEMVGATREAVNKQLGRLREMGVIQTGRNQVRILKPERLRAIALGNVTEFTFQT